MFPERPQAMAICKECIPCNSASTGAEDFEHLLCKNCQTQTENHIATTIANRTLKRESSTIDPDPECKDILRIIADAVVAD